MEAGNPACEKSQVRCIACDRRTTSPGADFRCESCGDLLELHLNAAWLEGREPAEWKRLWLDRRRSYETLDQSGVWRFREWLPILRNPLGAVTLREGNTPLYALPECGREAGIAQLWAKHQGANPTGSFKDTGMTAAVSRAREEGQSWIACASTGNTAASMAAYAARAGIRSLVLVPEGKIAWSKLAQALDYGALTCQLRTDFDGCVAVLSEVLRRAPVFLANSVNPYRIEGQKTAAIELLEATAWELPDHVVVPGGNLANGSALGKAFLELRDWGFIDRLPRVSIIQAEGANPLARAMRDHRGSTLEPVRAETFATAIRIGKPASWKKAVRVLEQTGGHCIDVTESEIAAAKIALGREGVACEPASAAALAGARKLVRQNLIAMGESVALILTGHGLKDPDYTVALHQGQLPVQLAGAALRGPLALDARADAVLREMERH